METNFKTVVSRSKVAKGFKAVLPHLLKQLFESLRKDHAVNGFKGAGLFPPNIKRVEHRIILTQRATDQLDVSFISFNTIVLQESTPATPDAAAELPSCSSKHDKTIQDAINLLSSPFKDLKCGILTTLSPVQLSATKAAIINSKKKRKRVQHRAGEVMTGSDEIECLHKEELERMKNMNFELPQLKHEKKKHHNKSI
ncbi:hypothetical protein AVEN_86760-1 [Araneus ventricosus]|uniref:Uncharacterized protein n=1 Tax=Araneus ventricosus TaxID=182803 RepID=A0A4Y2UWB0_ARAVE|nr:hypothetical protein AVEN_86760-1 [Araneus ventricosus]